MKNRFKKITSVILAAAIMLCCAPLVGIESVFSFKSEALDIIGDLTDTISYYLDESDGTLSINGTGDMPDYSTEKESPFYNNRDIRRVIIYNGITKIGENTFNACNNITDAVLPESLLTIGGYAFNSCYALEEITIPDSVTSIGERAFYHCNALEKAKLGSGVKTIGSDAFYGCDTLKEINIPAGVTSIGYRALFSCFALEKIDVDPENTAYCSVDGVLYNKKMTKLIIYPTNNSERSEFTVPDTVTNIDTCAFAENIYLKKVVLNNVKTISLQAFRKSQIEEFVLSDSLTYIGESAFEDCDGAKKFTLGNNVSTISTSAFYSCSFLEKINIPDSVTAISYLAFAGNMSLKKFDLGNNVSTVGGSAFNGCSAIKELIIHEKLKSVGTDAFAGCKSLTDIYYDGTEEQWAEISVSSGNEYFTAATVHFNRNAAQGSLSDNIDWTFNEADGVLTISGEGRMPNYENSDENTGLSPFYNDDSIKKVVIDDGITYIGENTFSGCDSLTDISLPQSVTEIGYVAVGNCDSLKTFNISASIENIGEGILYRCINLENITVDKNNPNFISENGVLFDKNKTELIKYPAGKKDSSYTVPESVRTIDKYAFEYARNIENITMPQKLETISTAVFQNSSIKKVIFTGTVKTIEDFAFNLCENLAEITFPEGLKKIGERAFVNCPITGTVILPDSLEILGNSAFDGCDSFDSIILPENIDSLSASRFCYNPALKDVYFKGTEEQWNSLPGADVFSKKPQITVHYNWMPVEGSLSGTVGWSFDEEAGILTVSGTGSVPDYEKCPAGIYKLLKAYDEEKPLSVVVKNGITSIGENMFNGCAGVTEAVLAESVQSAGNNAFGGCENLRIVYAEAEKASLTGAFDNENTAFIVKADSETAKALENQGRQTIPYNTDRQKDGKKVISFYNTTTVYPDAACLYLSYIAEENKEAYYFYFDKLAFDGVKNSDIGEIEISEDGRVSETPDENFALQKVYISIQYNGKTLTFDKILDMIRSGNYSAVIQFEEEGQKTIFERIGDFFETLFADAFRAISKAIKFITNIFKKK